jgi:(6-4)DNA photolyase
MAVETLRVVLGGQLSPDLSALVDLDPLHDVVLRAEVMGECTYVPHHLKKITLVLSAMRHFSAALSARGVRVRYVRLDDPANTYDLRGEVRRAVAELAVPTPIRLWAAAYPPADRKSSRGW